MNKYIKYSLFATLLIGGVIIFTSWRSKAANVAARFLDEIEVGNNQGFTNKAFEQMMKDVGWRGGEAWCMYLAKAVWMQAFPKKAALIAKYLTGSTQTSWKNAKANPEIFKVITDGKPMPGDIVIWQSTTNSTLGHAGIVKNKKSDQYEVVEGNTSLQGARDGQGVEKNTRNLEQGYVDGTLKVLGFIRLKL